MNKLLILKSLFYICLIILASSSAFAKKIISVPAKTIFTLSADSTIKKQPASTDKKKEEVKDEIKKPEIKEVPKSRRQLKPIAVKPKIKTPVKIRPVIKRPAGLIRKTLGR
ncbi:hypothetical protein [Daejeonella oryzae]|uniref:hypothetical protein n=1 Tax=Daejeonella oryzae TaxID=1122943 RepID=UPI000478F59C|nr:hypothetical protein [Daejeonella oryzae]